MACNWGPCHCPGVRGGGRGRGVGAGRHRVEEEEQERLSGHAECQGGWCIFAQSAVVSCSPPDAVKCIKSGSDATVVARSRA